jgi:DNA-directed RNA polymerase specialized sigma24 family protein
MDDTGQTDLFDPLQLEILYRDFFGELADVGTSRFGLAGEEAELLAHEVFLAGLRHLPRIREPRAWLIAAMVFAAGWHKEHGARHNA